MYEEIANSQTSNIVIGACLILIFCAVAEYLLHDLAVPAIAGFFCIGLANLAGYGLLAVSMTFNHTMLQALPLLGLGLGVDDLFMLIAAFHDAFGEAVADGHKDPKEASRFILGHTMMHAGSAVAITSFCNAIVCFASTSIPTPAFR